MRRRLLTFSLLVAAMAACGDDDPTGAAALQYTLQPPATALSVGQDSTVPVGVSVMRQGVDTSIKNVRLLYSSLNNDIAVVDAAGLVRGLSGGTTSIRVSGAGPAIEVPVTVRARPATHVELSVLSGPASVGIIGTRLNTMLDTGTFYALPADPGSSRLRAVVRIGNDTVYCNYCKFTTPFRPQRVVRFRSLNPELATVTNPTDPTAPDSTAAAGRVTPLDTSSTGVKIVLEVPGDGLADTVTLKLALRPLDSLVIRADSGFFPTANGTGLQKQRYPNADDANFQANVVAGPNVSFVAGVTFKARVIGLPNAGSNTNPASTLIDVLQLGGATARRANLPSVTWESANVGYLTVNAAGAIVAQCAFIGGTCPAPSTQPLRDAQVINCNDATGNKLTGGSAFAPPGTYAVPSCTGKAPIPMPGAFCSTASSTDFFSTCSIWIRATARDQATPKILQNFYRINVRR